MEKRNWGMEELRDYLRENPSSNIICFGAGMVARHVGYIFERNGLWDRVCCFVDNDTGRQGAGFTVGTRVFPIMEPARLYGEEYSSDIVIILAEYTAQIEKQLMSEGFAPRFYIAYPHMNERLIAQTFTHEKNVSSRIMKIESGGRIPPILHYCWFGEEKIPEEHLAYLQTWKRLCPHYTIMFWNESNYDINVCRYVREAYETKNYAFVSDYVRMDVIYRYGGVYMDTDVELKKNIDGLLKYKAFFAFGKWPAVNSGCGFGAEPEADLIKRMRDKPRKDQPFVREDGQPDKTTNSIYETAVMEELGFQMDFSTQLVQDVLLLSPYYFSSSLHAEMPEMDENLMIARHHDAGSWRRELC